MKFSRQISFDTQGHDCKTELVSLFSVSWRTSRLNYKLINIPNCRDRFSVQNPVSLYQYFVSKLLTVYSLKPWCVGSMFFN